ncbi:GntR family transcriptional regulator [Salinicola lusitanus]|uniref:GntR family transcriptional regulator n=1 Tax=Salinicola lusitanus TaxID=1949085 RepID=UPI00197CE453|nr:GntR family transcriptional regulator [Salinicola lusitanus]
MIDVPLHCTRLNMHKPVRFDKKQRVIDELTRRIHSGRLRRGKRLPGEHQLAEELEVSRGTLREALLELKRQSYIATQTGVGSIVTYDGVEIDPQRGWAQALAETGADLQVEMLRLATIEEADLQTRFGVERFIAVDRRRSTRDGLFVSLERSRVPALPALIDLPARGLVDDSLTATLRAAGLEVTRGEQSVDIAYLDAESANLLTRDIGTPVLRSTRTTFNQQGSLVEHVVSLLDPDHFRLHLHFGT